MGVMPVTLDPDVQAILDELDERRERDREAFKKEGFDADKAALAAGPETAGLLNLMIRMTGAKHIVEVGTSMGYTALWLGEAARATGGHVIGTEALEAKHAIANDYIARAGLSGIVEVRLGDAKASVAAIEGPIDLVFVDAWKTDYIDYFDMLLAKMRIGGAIVADNITFPESNAEVMAGYMAHVRGHANVRSDLVPIGNGIEVSVRTG
ncbi:MAG TPA: class I SAM-dependent methyltransferase [Alphaproteobacteria bacterium]|nr:class I SAM-dependent methyltransferase [Alphaproteobacteria bacterium]